MKIEGVVVRWCGKAVWRVQAVEGEVVVLVVKSWVRVMRGMAKRVP